MRPPLFAVIDYLQIFVFLNIIFYQIIYLLDLVKKLFNTNYDLLMNNQ
jgi:hypothetical protein